LFFAWIHIQTEKLLSCNFTTNDVSIHNVNLDKMLNPNLVYKKLECIRTNVFFFKLSRSFGWQHPKNT